MMTLRAGPSYVELDIVGLVGLESFIFGVMPLLGG